MTENDSTKHFFFSGFKLDMPGRALYGPDGELVALSSRAHDVLALLVTHPGEAISKSAIIEAVWPDSVVEDNNLNQAISCLRKALNDNKPDSRIIHTIPGRGYCFVAKLDGPFQPAATVDTGESAGQAVVEVPPSRGVQQESAVGPAARFSKAGLAVAAMVVLAIVIFFLKGAELSSVSTDSPAVPMKDTSDNSLIPNSIAILPFINLNPEQEEKVLSQGLVDELINQLTKVDSLKIISNRSVLAQMGQGKSLEEIGRGLRVEWFLNGSILIVGNNARINLRLVDPYTSLAIWSASYDEDSQDMANMIATQGEIARDVAHTLEKVIRRH